MSRDKWGHEDNARISELEKGVGHLTTENIAKGLMVESLAARIRHLEGVLGEVERLQRWDLEGMPSSEEFVEMEDGCWIRFEELEEVVKKAACTTGPSNTPATGSPLPKEQNHE